MLSNNQDTPVGTIQLENSTGSADRMPLDNQVFQQFGDFFNEVARMEHWNSLGNTLNKFLFGNLISTAILLMVILFGFMAYQRLLFFSDRIIRQANRDETVSSQSAFHLLLSSSAASILSWLPFCLLGVALWVYSSRTSDPSFHASLGLGLIAIFFVGVGFRLVQEFYSHGGLSEAVYGFKYANARYIVNRLESTIYLIIPFVFAVAFSSQFQNGRWNDSIGKLSFMIAALIAFWQFHSLLWPNSKLYQRLSNDEATADSRFLRYRVFTYVTGVTFFFLAIGLTLGGWLEHANSLSINVALTVFSGLLLFALKTVLTRQSAEIISKLHLVEDFGRPAEGVATLRSPRVQAFLSQHSRTAQRGIEFLSMLVFAVVGYWIWRKWITLPPELLNFRIGGMALSGILVTAKLLIVGLITYYCARELPSFVMWSIGHYTKWTVRNPRLAAQITGGVIWYLGVWIVVRLIGVELPVIPWLGTLLTIAVLYAGRQFIEDGISGLRLMFDNRVLPGDSIEIDGRFGRVEEVTWFTTIMQDNFGTRNVIPNSRITSQTVIKSSEAESVPLVIDVTLPRNADAYQAQALMMMVAQRDPAILSEPPPHVRFAGFRINEIRFQIRMLTLASEDIAETRQRIDDKLTIEFERHEILREASEFDVV